MKRILNVLIAGLILTFTTAYAEADLSSYSLEQLLELRNEVGQAIHDARSQIVKNNGTITHHENEIVFRNLAWGDTYEQVKSKYPGIGTYGSSSAYPVTVFSWAGGSSPSTFENGELTVSYSCYGDYSVAGYETSMNFLFAYTVTEPIQREEENTMLIGARYWINQLSDPDGVATDLIEKLSSVYGEYAATSTSRTLGGYPLNYYFWYGKNDTFVVLKEMNGGKADSNEVTIYYGWRESDQYLYAFDAAVSIEKDKSEASHFGDGNTDGL